jgi:hypothetical protein
MEALTAFADHLPDGGIGDEFAPSHMGQRLFESGTLFALAATACRPEDVAGRKVTGSKLLVQEIGLRSLTYSWRPEQNQPLDWIMGLWKGLAKGLRASQPRSSV